MPLICLHSHCWLPLRSATLTCPAAPKPYGANLRCRWKSVLSQVSPEIPHRIGIANRYFWVGCSIGYANKAQSTSHKAQATRHKAQGSPPASSKLCDRAECRKQLRSIWRGEKFYNKQIVRVRSSVLLESSLARRIWAHSAIEREAKVQATFDNLGICDICGN